MTRLTKSHMEFLGEYLKTPKNAIAYLNEALKDEDERLFIKALSNVARVYGGGMAKIARKANVGRESLYKTLSGRSNPKFKNIYSVLNAMGLGIEIKKKAELGSKIAKKKIARKKQKMLA